jgi:alpha-tubulin suppressor-like RCC1 family protein
MPYQPTLNFKLSDGRDLGNLGWITKEYLMTVYPQIAANMITPELWVWGTNSFGQLGVNDTTQRNTPVTTSAGGANWKQVSSTGYNYTAAVKTDGTLWTWGRNSYGQLGDNTTGQRNAPVQVFGSATNWKQVTCGFSNYATAAIKTDGTLWTWGYNAQGQVGDNTTTQRLTPVTTFAGGTNWKQVSGGQSYTLAVKTDGTLWGWGTNGFGQLGINDTTQRNTPVQVFGSATNWKQVSCGINLTAAIKTDGTLWTWGSNGSGQLGIDGTNNRTTPVQVFGSATNWKQVACGRNHTSAIKTDGTLWTWGANASGQLGINNITQRNTPVTTFAGGTNWKQVACGGYFTAAIKTDGTLWTWGTNYGALGDNTTTTRLTPVTTFAGGTNWKQVSAGGSHTAAIETSDDLLGI